MSRVVALGCWAAFVCAVTVLAQSDVQLLRRGSISGRVVDAGGAPVSGVVVETRRWGSSRGKAFLANGGNKATTDEGGRFQLAGVVPGDYAIEASPGFDPFPEDVPRRASGFGVTYYPDATQPDAATLVAVAPDQALQGIEIVLATARLASISGVVLDADGRPLARAPVRAKRDDAEMSSCGVLVTSQADGAFLFPNLPPGRYEVDLERPPPRGGPFQDARLTAVVDGDDVSVRLGAVRFDTIHGHITFDDPVAAQSASRPAIQILGVPVDPDAEPHSIPIARIRDDLSFDADVRPGAIVLRAFAQGWTLARVRVHGRDVTDTGFDLAREGPLDDVQVEFTNHRQEVAGIVRNESGAPAPHAAVLLFADDGTKWRTPLDRYIAWTDSDDAGRYAIDTLPPGDYRVVALDRHAADWHDPVLLAALRPSAARATLHDRESLTVDLRLSPLPGWVQHVAGPSYGIAGSISCGGPPPKASPPPNRPRQ